MSTTEEVNRLHDRCMNPEEFYPGNFRTVRGANALMSGLLQDAAAEMRELVVERDALARWKSTNAPRLETLEGLLADSQMVAANGREAIRSLRSEREANAILTQENEALRAQAKRAHEAISAMQAEFRGYDLPYGSKAYALANEVRLELEGWKK